MQVPVNDLQAAIYQWIFHDSTSPREGHVISLGAETSGIRGVDIDPGEEGWFDQQGTNHQEGLRILLAKIGAVEDLTDAIMEIAETETQYATADVVPSWTSNWSIPTNASLYTVSSVSWQGGTGITPVVVVEEFTVLFFQGSSLVPPRWFRKNGLATSNLFGFPDNETFNLEAGSSVILTPVAPTERGYPEGERWEATTI
jgi:hypothetical protein